MSWFATADPLALLALQAGVQGTPTGAGLGADPMAGDQASTALGDPIPVVWARWRDGAGGVLLSPPATEVRYEQALTGDVQASYHLLLGEGAMSPVEVRDVFSGSVRVGSFNQTYNRRAGLWNPGNYLTDLSLPEIAQLSQYCGSIGTYPGCSTLSYQIVCPPGDFSFKRQVNIFIRGGINVTRLADNIYGPSDNFADLILWLMQRSAYVPAELIDIPALTATALFLDRYQLSCNCIISQATSIPDLIANWGPSFLVTESRNGGKIGLRPLLPTDAQGNILAGTLTPAYRFTIDNVDPDSLEINYAGLSTRQPFVAQTRWRQQPSNDLGIDRILETSLAGTATSGPYELEDLSEFATREIHAARAGAFKLSRRLRIDHTARWATRPGNHATSLAPGAIVRLTLPREAWGEGYDEWDYLYLLQRITRGVTGGPVYEAVHLPVNGDRVSLTALDVLHARGTGILLSPQRTGIVQDENSASDSSVPPDVGIDPTDSRAAGSVAAGGRDSLPNQTQEMTEEPPTEPEDGPGDPQIPAARNQQNSNTPATLQPTQCENGQEPYATQWYYKGTEGNYKLYKTVTTDPAYTRRSVPILPVPPQELEGEATIITPGAKFYAQYYCPKPSDTTDAQKRDPSNIRYTREYKVTPQDLAPFTPLHTTGVPVGNTKAVAYSVRYLRNDGPVGNPLYWTDASWLGYHQLLWPAVGNLFTFQPIANTISNPFDYYNPEDPAHTGRWNIIQGPSVIAYDITYFHIGPASSLQYANNALLPPDWTSYTWNNNGQIVTA